jgi:hypothetical protein
MRARAFSLRRKIGVHVDLRGLDGFTPERPRLRFAVGLDVIGQRLAHVGWKRNAVVSVALLQNAWRADLRSANVQI